MKAKLIASIKIKKILHLQHISYTNADAHIVEIMIEEMLQVSVEMEALKTKKKL